ERAHDEILNLEYLIERFAASAVHHVEDSVRTADITGIDVTRGVAPLEVPQHERDGLSVRLHFAPIDLHADSRQVLHRKNRMHIPLNEAGLPGPEHADHANLFLKHSRPPECPPPVRHYNLE